MAGEGRERIVSNAAIAGGRLAKTYAFINNEYAPPSPQSEARELFLEDYNRHIDETGHDYDLNCTLPWCQRVREFMRGIPEQLIQGAPNASI